MRVLKNLTAEAVQLTDQDPEVVLPAGESVDLSEVWTTAQMANSEQLLLLLARSGEFVLSDGTRDLTFSESTDLLRGYAQRLPTSTFGRLRVESEKPSGSGIVICSHNFCSPCSWYGTSRRVEAEILTAANAERTLYRSARKWWIDISHGLLTREGSFGSPYRPRVRVNGAERVEGVDFIVDYTHGEVHFAWLNPFISDCAYQPGVTVPRLGMGPLAAGDVVSVDYSHAETSLFSIRAKPGKILRIEKTEVQHTQDVLIHSAIIFETWMPNPGNPEEMIPIPKEYGGERAVYKGASDFVNEGNQGVGSLRSFGGGAGLGQTKRGIRHDVSVYPFDYLRTKDLNGDLGVELRIWILNDVPLDGEYASITLYCGVEACT